MVLAGVLLKMGGYGLIRLNLELLPHVLNYVLFSFNLWTMHIKKIYGFDFSLNIKDIFISRYSENDFQNKNISNYKNNSFLTLEIQLNNTIDFSGGCIEFENEEELLLMAGDMIVFNGKRKRKPANVVSGEKFVLIVITEIADK